MEIGRNALYFDDYVLAIQYFNQVIQQKPYLAEPYYLRAVAKISLDDYSGAIDDASQAIELNPFIKDCYRIRAVARHNSHSFAMAIKDYDKCLEFWNNDKDLLLNKGMCNMALKNYEQADSCFKLVMERDTTNERLFLAMTQMCLDRADTTQALTHLNRAITINPKNVQARLMRCEILMNSVNDTKAALLDIDEVINLEPQKAEYRINRSFMRYQANDYRGTMDDLDYAIAIDPANQVAHYNRALLRTEVGAYNTAIDDYNFVLEHDPENYPALYNRTLLLINTGQYQQGIRGLDDMLAKDKNDFVALYQRAMLLIETHQYKPALRDLNAILAKYPHFESGYMIRAQLKQRLGDKKGYQNDLEYAVKVMKQKGVHYSDFNPVAQEKKNSQDIYDRRFKQYRDKQEQEYNDKREKQEKELEEQLSLEESVEKVKERFSKLLIVDVNNDIMPEVSLESDGFYDEKLGKRRYRSKSRGYIQDNNVDVAPEKPFALSFYSYDNKLNGRTHFMKEMSQVNDMRLLALPLALNNLDYNLSEYDAKKRFDGIEYYNGVLADDDNRAIDYFGRAMDHYLLKNADAAIADATQAINLSPDFMLAYFLRFNARFLKLRINEKSLNTDAMLAAAKRRADIDALTDDITRVIALSPRNPYAYYNHACLLATNNDYDGALKCYDKAISLKPDFAEAYFNRGLIHMSNGDKEKGTLDLSKAGELGIIASYNILKRMAR